jgi:FKBP-type peptidyl-prolyl cis-trans isomerase
MNTMKRYIWLAVVAAAGVGLATACVPAKGADDKKDDPKVTTTDSGLKYADLTVGDGAVAKKGDNVVVNYTGWLTDGTKFDSSVGKKPFEFQLGNQEVIKGWDEGVAGMKVGGKRRLLIPSKLGYGKRGAGRVIPADADLVFDVELLKVE